jgi:hypothetical protein
MISWRKWIEYQDNRTARKMLKVIPLWYSKGFEEGSAEMKEYLSEQIIHAINQDAVLRMTVDVDTLERVVEVIEAVRDIGKAHS